MTIKDILRHLGTGLAILLSGGFFLLVIELIRQYIKLSKGLLAWGALFSILLLGIGEIVYIFLIASFFKKRADKNQLASGVFMVLSIQFFLFFFLAIGRVLVFLPALRTSRLPFYALWSWIDYTNAVGGFGLGVLFMVLTARFTKPPAGRKKISASGPVGSDAAPSSSDSDRDAGSGTTG